jgi:SAM-dependent methyltransferase
MKISEEKQLHANYFKGSNVHITRYKWITTRYFNTHKRYKILEIGCGDGGVIQYLKDNHEVQGVDIAESGIKYLKTIGINAHLLDVSYEKLPFKDDYFDYVLIFEVFEHLKSPQLALEEIQRVLKPSGILLASIPNPKTGHKYIYPPLFKFSGFEEYLINNGFMILSSVPYGVCLPFNLDFNKRDTRLNSKIPSHKNHPDRVSFSNKVIQFLATLSRSDFITKIKPKRFAWLVIFEARNKHNKRTKEIYKEIAEETSKAYN